MTIAARICTLLVLASLALAPSIASAQESRSAPIAAELTRLLDEQKLDAVAARLDDDRFVAALYFPGTQLLVVGTRYSAPNRLLYLIANRMYQEAYADLSSATEQATKLFVMDLGANGLQFRRKDNEPFDTVDTPTGSLAFNGERGKLSNDEYRQAFTTTDEQYREMLEKLVAELKK